ncbi:GNAT family N-acetyltransferase [Nocardia tengchongensis]|uniref:GNAT family N-acetyltransferase n=1 Tax=Nocardia tengchongensis TaxID=2055889 RepID=UPI00369115D4
MGWTITEDPTAYMRAAGEFLHSDPIRNTVLITVPDRLLRQGLTIFGDAAPHFGWWTTTGGAVTAAFFRTPPFGIVVSPLPSESVAPLVRDYSALDPALSAVSGPADSAHAVAELWARTHGTAITSTRADRLYRLGDLVPPDPAPPGIGRLATDRDRDLAIDWLLEFTRDIGDPPPAHPDRMIDERLTSGGLSLWEVDGAPVSMAGTGAPVAGTIRIGPVFTPKPLRGKGFAAAATTHACRAARATGATDIMLFADLANRTSTALYQRLGFRPVGDYSICHLA